MKNTRIVFMGTPEFASNVLEGLIQNGYNIVGVVTQADKKIGRKQILTYTKVKEVALKYDIKVLQPIKIREDYEDILALEPELIITCAYGQIIPSALLDYPKYGCINTHGSLLPKYRGGAPIQWSIINGDKETGITIMYMDKKMDEGDILFQEKIVIELEDTNASMFAKLSDLALKMLLEHLDDIISGNINPVKQDHTIATYAYNLKKEDELISFNRDYMTVYNHIRGLLDNPGAYSIIDGKKIKFHKVRCTDEVLVNPGVVYGIHNGGLLIGAINGSIIVDEIQSEGKNKMNAKDFFNGAGKNLVNKMFI